MRIFLFGVLVLAACQGQRSVYDEQVPVGQDAQNYSYIADRLRQDDKEAWASIAARQMTSAAGTVRSRTVGEAIRRWKAQRACLQLHAKGQDSAGSDVRARNREIDAYNDCLEMEI